MNPSVRTQSVISGLWVSVVAAVLILALLVQLQLFGVRYAYSPPGLIQMFVIWLLSLPATYFYFKSNLDKALILKVAAPLAIAVTAVGLSYTALTGGLLGLELIVLGYLFEPIAGISIFLTLREFSPESYMFIVGAFAYTYGFTPLLLRLRLPSYDWGRRQTLREEEAEVSAFIRPIKDFSNSSKRPRAFRVASK